jgi:hypothetical protein
MVVSGRIGVMCQSEKRKKEIRSKISRFSRVNCRVSRAIELRRASRAIKVSRVGNICRVCTVSLHKLQNSRRQMLLQSLVLCVCVCVCMCVCVCVCVEPLPRSVPS